MAKSGLFVMVHDRMNKALILTVLSVAVLAGCVDDELPERRYQVQASPVRVEDRHVDDFMEVAAAVEPVAESTCNRINPGLNCDFKIVVDPDPAAPMNAYQTVDRNGWPLIVFTQRMIAEFANKDEIAFVTAHEAAHHILGHIPQQQKSAMVGGVLLGLAGAAIARNSDVGRQAGADSFDSAFRLGSFIGSRAYSKEHEIEADELGAVIAESAGYDAVVGVQLFNRVPDPGNQFLGSHPPNAQRIDAVRRVASRF